MIDLTQRGASGADISFTIIGVGGAGCQVLDRMALDGVPAGLLIAAHTDAQGLTASVAGRKIQLGGRGLGSGGDPEVGRAAAEEGLSEVRRAVDGCQAVFLLAGLGGGTGSGAAPVIAQAAKEAGALVIAVVSVPFSFEGERRKTQATEALEALRAEADLVVCFENDRMGELVEPTAAIDDAFSAANQTMGACICVLAGLITRRGLLHLGYDDLRSTLGKSHLCCLFGYGEAEGSNRVYEAVANALRNPLMDKGRLLKEGKTVLVSVTGGQELTLHEVQLLMEELNRFLDPGARLLFGVSVDPSFSGRMALTVVSALGVVEEERPVVSARRQTAENHEEAASVHGMPARSSGFLRSRREPGPGESPFELEDEEAEREEEAAEPVASASRKAPTQETLKFEPVTRGRFAKSEPTIVDGQDLDVPTFMRHKIRIRI
ncbi:MAG TPA: cell division protein FtsZ [Chthoniobacteraceae bacterium]|nr:cell division protein FtsZ [Chthoniobacteraceae bacterium]